MKKYRVYNIDWDVNNEEERDSLPTEMIVEDENDLTNENYELSDWISDKITEETGYCHMGCDFSPIITFDEKDNTEEIEDRESLFTEVKITHIDEQTNLAYIDAWETPNPNEEGRVLGVINLTNKKVNWRKETSGEERIDPLVVEEIREFIKTLDEEEERPFKFRVTHTKEEIVSVTAKDREEALAKINKVVESNTYLADETDVNVSIFPITDGEWLKYSVVVDTEGYGKIYCVPRFDTDTNEDFFELYDDTNGYYGELCGCSEEEITAEIVEEQIDNNLE